MTKTKNPRIAPNDRFRRRQPRFHAASSSEFHGITLATPKSPTTKDIDRCKRVKFSAPENNSPRSCRLEGSYIPSERDKKVTAYKDPKTSEYAFFKKLKKDAGLRFHSRPLQKDDFMPKKPVPTEYSSERTDNARLGREGLNASRIIEDISTVKTDTFLSPSGGIWNNSDLYSVSRIQKNSQGCSDTFKPRGICSHEGNQYVHGEIFSRKRQKLRQCVADALFPDIEKFSLKGHDIVSMLLGRLFPMSIEENKYKDPNPGKEVNVTGYDLPDSQGSDVQFKEHDQIPSRKLLEQSSSYFSDNLLSPMLLSSDERITAHAAFPTSHSLKFQHPYCTTDPEYKFGRIPSFSSKRDVTLGFLHNEVMNATGDGLLDSQESDVQFKEHHQIPETKLLEFEPNSCIRGHLLSPSFLRSNERSIPQADFPTSYSHKFQPLYSKTEPECDFGGIPSFSAKSDVTLKFLFNEQEHDTFALNHFKELGKLKREPIPLPLEKDFDCPTDNINLPIAYKYPQPDLVPALSTLGNGEEQVLKNIVGEYHFSPSSLLLDKPQDIASILDSGLLRYQEFRFGKYVYEEKDDMYLNFNHAVLPMSPNKHYFRLSADCKNNTSCVQDSLYLQPYQHWIRRTAYNDYHHDHPDSEPWLSSSFNLISGQRCLSLTSSQSNYQGSNSSTLQLPRRESMPSLFHINDNFEQEMNGGNQGEILYHFSEGLIEVCNSSFLRKSMQRENGCPLPMDRSDYNNELGQTHNVIL